MEDTSVFSETRGMADRAILYDEFDVDALDVS